MSEPGRTPRIAPISAEERDDEVNALLTPSAAKGTNGTNLFGTLIRNRELYKVWRPLARHLNANSTLPIRNRELAILRTAWLCRSEYEWGQHVLAGRMAGLTDEEIERVRSGPDAAGWSKEDAVAIRVVDQLHGQGTIDDAEWAALASRFDDSQLIEFVLFIGFYFMTAFTLNALGVRPEDGVPAAFQMS